ncbi:hypothetical protein BJX64DRAFT_288535 [Aspergillus heterothallicus]
MAHPSKPVSGEERPGNPPPDVPLVMLGGPTPTDQRDFMFVGIGGDGSDGVPFGKRERVFVQRRFHREKKQASIDRLKTRLPTHRALKEAKENEQVAATATTIAKHPPQCVLARSQNSVTLTARPSRRYGDPFSTSATPMTGKLWMYLHHSIKTLNDLIQDPIRPATQTSVLLVSALLGNEATGANLDVLGAHTNRLTTLVTMMGGLYPFDHMMLSTLYQGALVLAALQDSVPIFTMLQQFLVSLSTLGIRFTTAPWQRYPHPKMQRILDSFRRVIRHFEISTIHPKVVAQTDNDLFVIIQYDLLSTRYPPTFHEQEDHHSPNLNDPLRLALMIYMYIRVPQLQTLPIIRCMAETLQQSLVHSGRSTFRAVAPDLLFWILFIGGMASQGYTSHPWFIGHLADVARDLGLGDWKFQVRPLLGEFFYTDRPG